MSGTACVRRWPSKRAARATVVGFTLVELLVVVGVMSLIIALLLPALAGARRQAMQVVCLSNLRQLGTALFAYANDHRGWFPAPAEKEQPRRHEDWVHWQPNRDMTESRLFRYLDSRLDVLRCPLGVPDRQAWKAKAGAPATYPPYPFSYSVNGLITGGNSALPHWPAPPGWTQPVPVGKIRHPTRTVLALEEDVLGIDDGAWPASGRITISMVSARHDGDRGAGDGGWPTLPDYHMRGRGNVCFADGHCEFFDRRTLYLERSNNPHRP